MAHCLWLCYFVLLMGSCQALPFLWPSSFRGTTTTTTTSTTHTGPPHPHAQNNHGTGTTPVIGHSSHLHVRPAITSSYLTNRPLPPLVGAHHHHQHHHRPAITAPNGHMHHIHGGALAGPSVTGYSGHRHHLHVHQQHHHHPHSSARVLQSHIHPAALHFPFGHV